tara:strand:+ start:492 stop:779 length:288 start_codon:yes stop_codon:yes gene_type:complete
MTQYNERVDQQRKLLKAEELADNITNIHVHSLNSMWYDDRPQDTENHSVTDIDYLSGKIERTLHDGTKIVLVEGATGNDLVSKVEASLTDSGKTL